MKIEKYYKSISIKKYSKKRFKTIYRLILRFKYIELSEFELRALIFLIILLKLYSWKNLSLKRISFNNIEETINILIIILVITKILTI